MRCFTCTLPAQSFSSTSWTLYWQKANGKRFVQNLQCHIERRFGVYIYMLQAVTYARTFHLQSHFSMDEMLLPLVGMDKMNLVEKSIYLLFS